MGDFTKSLGLRRWWREREGWERISSRIDGAQYRREGGGARVILSVARELDGRMWVHVSVTCSGRLPSYDELCEVKRDFIGEHRKAIQVFAAKSEHVNIHPNCLHMWHCIEGDGLPDFTQGSGSI